MSKPVMSCLVALLLVAPAGGTSFSTDNSDLWLARSEDGWGVQIVHRADVMFATIYVYDASNLPIYYTGTLTFAGTNATGNAIWVGDLYVTNGPWLGAPVFNSSQVTYRIVGQITYVAQYTESGLLRYSVDGVLVDKEIYRYTLRYDNYTGSYLGAYKLTATGCSNPANNGTQLIPVAFNVGQTANSLTIAAATQPGFTCIYPGDYQQFGQFGQTRGSYTCTNGESGTYTLFEMNVTNGDLRGRILGTNNLGCSLSGRFAALRQ